MNKILTALFLSLALLFTTSLHAQTQEDKLDLPGDNLNLFAVMKLFQESQTLEGFERKLNNDSTHINNLDLNADNKTDYIKVIDNVEADVHTIVLQVDLNAAEKQDVAVFTVQKDASNKTQIQLIGDEELYGKNYIIEPNMDDVEMSSANETPNPGYNSTTNIIDDEQIPVTPTNTVVISSWPIVQYVYTPDYAVWRSPWNWGYYPSYYRPWRPVYWHSYWGYQHNWNYYYYSNYRRWNQYRYSRYNDYYYSRIRVQSPYYAQRRQAGFYKTTYSRPDTRRQGEAAFIRTNPGRSVVNNNNSLPVVRPATPRPAINPVRIKPVRPAITPLSPDIKPVRPVMPNPGIKPSPVRPVVDPIVKPVRQKPLTPIKPIRQKPLQTPQREPRIRSKEIKPSRD